MKQNTSETERKEIGNLEAQERELGKLLRFYTHELKENTSLSGIGLIAGVIPGVIGLFKSFRNIELCRLAPIRTVIQVSSQIDSIIKAINQQRHNEDTVIRRYYDFLYIKGNELSEESCQAHQKFLEDNLKGYSHCKELLTRHKKTVSNSLKDIEAYRTNSEQYASLVSVVNQIIDKIDFILVDIAKIRHPDEQSKLEGTVEILDSHISPISPNPGPTPISQSQVIFLPGNSTSTTTDKLQPIELNKRSTNSKSQQSLSFEA